MMNLTNSTVEGTGARRRCLVIGGFLCVILLAWGSDIVWAGAPEYMKLKSRVGMAVEVEGQWDTSGVFVADDIEELPRPRSPKIRGPLQGIDLDKGLLYMYGRPIAVDANTEMIEHGSSSSSWKNLKIGQRIEISCRKVDSTGRWRARKLRTHGVKTSDKVKGTITRFHIDGQEPDTLFISGLPVLLVRPTDILRPEGALYPSVRELFGALGRGSMEAMPAGWPVGHSMHLAVQYRLNAYDQSEFDLTSTARTDVRATEHQLRTGFTAFISPQFVAHAHLRVRKLLLHTNERGIPLEDLNAHFTQLFALVQPERLPGAVAQVGRQRFREPREWVFDEYQDAIRLYYHGKQPWVFEAAYIHAIDPIKPKFATWTDYFARIRFYTDPKSRVAAYVLARRDSDETRRRQPVWWGLRYIGHVTSSVDAWADLALQRGEDKLRPVRSWAMDLGTTVTAVKLKWRPAVTLGYASASGDSTNSDAYDHTFRQTGYEDNVGRLSGIARTKYYGNLLDPELSNLKVLTASLGVQPIHGASVELVYHTYQQDQPDAELRGSGLVDPPARPNGVSTDIGWALDFVVRVPRLWRVLNIKWTSSVFNPGEAFAPREANAYFSQVNVTLGV